MKYKLCAVDIDGTLVNNNKLLSNENKTAVKSFVRKGGIFVIASGRAESGAEVVSNDLELYDLNGYIISFNGARIKNAATGEVIYQKYLPSELLEQVFIADEKYNLGITTYVDDTAITERACNEYFKAEADFNKLKIKRVKSLRKEITYNIPKFLIAGEPEIISRYEKILKTEIKGLNVFRSDPIYLEIIPPNVDKGSAFKFLIEYLNIEKENTMAIGDGFNDVCMLKEAGFAVAVENAQPEVKNAAHFITYSNENNGVAYALERFV